MHAHQISALSPEALPEPLLHQIAWPHVFRPGSSDRAVLLMLHGTGGNEQEITQLAELLDPAAAVLSPLGRVNEDGMARWFRRYADGSFDVDDVVRRAGELAMFIAWARRAYDLKHQDIVAIGFSNGANMALATALLHPESVGRVIAFSGMFPLDDRSVPTNLSHSKVLLLNGRSDAMAPLKRVRALASELTAHGAHVEQHLRDGGHGITAADIMAAAAWLARTP